jgi:hypothetical protein
MIRQGTKYDKTQIIKMMKQFRAEADFPELLKVDNEEHWNTMLDGIFAGQGVVFLKEGKGLLMAIVLPPFGAIRLLQCTNWLGMFARKNETQQ